MSGQNTAVSGRPSQFFDKEAWWNIVVSAYNFLSASAALAQALDNKYSITDQLPDSTSKHEVDGCVDECPLFANMITESNQIESVHKIDDEQIEIADVSMDEDSNNNELSEFNEISSNVKLDEKLDLPDILSNTNLNDDLDDYKQSLSDISVNNFIIPESDFLKFVPSNVLDIKVALPDISLKQSSIQDSQLTEISPNEIMDEKLELSDISLNKILNCELMLKETLPNKIVDCDLIPQFISSTELLNINDTSNIKNVAGEEIPKVLCQEINVCDEISTSPIQSVNNTSERISIDSIINTALDTLCLLEAAIIDIERSEQTSHLLNFIYDDPFQEHKLAYQNPNILSNHDNLHDSCLEALECLTPAHSQSEYTINSAAMDSLDTPISLRSINMDNDDLSNLALPFVDNDRMMEVDIDLLKIINYNTEIKSKSELKEEIKESQPTVNRRFGETLKAQIIKQPKIQRELLEYSREQNSQKPIDFPASIQKLKAQLDKISRKGKKANQRNLYDHIVHISDMVAQLEHEHNLTNNLVAPEKLNKNRANLVSKKNSRPLSPTKKNTSNQPMQLYKTNEINSKNISKIKTDIDSKDKKGKMQSPKKKQALIKPEPVPNMNILEGFSNKKFVNTVKNKFTKRNLKTKKSDKYKHDLDHIFPKIEVVTSIANSKNLQYTKHLFEFRPTSSSEGRGRHPSYMG